MQLVEIKKLDLVTSTVAIADGVGRDHDTVIKLVDRNKADLEEFEGSDLKSEPFKLTVVFKSVEWRY